MDAQLSKDVLSELGSTSHLPSIPRVVVRALEIIDAPDADLDELTAVLGQDPTLVSGLLRVVNSAALRGAAGEISSLRDAVLRLGLSETKGVLVTHGVMGTFDAEGIIDLDAFWRHCATAGVAAAEMARLSPKIPDADETSSIIGGPYYLAGLLHDIGVLASVVAMKDAYVEVLRKNELAREPLWVTEEATFGFHHGTVGAALLYQWSLPEITWVAAEWHHAPAGAPEQFRDLGRVIHLADWMTHHFGIGDAKDGWINRFSDEAWNGLAMDMDQFPTIVTAMQASEQIGSGLLQPESR